MNKIINIIQYKNNAYNKWPISARIVLSVILIIGAYKETGIYTAICLFLLFTGLEMIGFLITKKE